MKRIANLVSFLLLGLQLLVTAQAEIREVTYLHTDGLGSPVVATDENGQVKWREQYLPYGDRQASSSANTADVGYTGHFEQADIGLTYAGARWYDPEVGRFLSLDPVKFTEANSFSFNRYAYASLNPYLYVDPDGEAIVSGAVFLVVAGINALTFSDYANAPMSNGDTHQRSRVEVASALMVSPALGGMSLLGNGGKTVAKGLTTPKKYFRSKTKQEVKDALEKKYGPPKSSREHADTYYNDKTKRSYNVHEEPGHNEGKPHVDIRRRGGYEERKYDLKEGD